MKKELGDHVNQCLQHAVAFCYLSREPWLSVEYITVDSVSNTEAGPRTIAVLKTLGGGI